MYILYCNIGKSKFYDGKGELIGGGSFNDKNVGLEIYNFFRHSDNRYYGWVQGNVDVKKHFPDTYDQKHDCSENVLVIWLTKDKQAADKYRKLHPETVGNHCIVGWYKNAKVYKEIQNMPENLESERENGYNFYNISVSAENAVLVPEKDRNFFFKYTGHSFVYNNSCEEECLKYIDRYKKK